MQPIDSFLTDWSDAERDGDTGALDTLLTADFAGVGPLGFVLPKQAWLARHRQGLSYQSFEVTEAQARVIGQTAVVIARNNTRGSYQGQPVPEAVRATLVLADDDGSWKLAAIHMSFIAGTAGAPAARS